MIDRNARFAGAYALANFGAFLCFVPLIGLLLPQRMAALAGEDQIRMLSWALLLGALVASIANIVGGWISDRLFLRHGSRLPLIGLGFALTCLSFIGLARAENPQQLIAAFLAFQLCFNLLFAPMAALVIDYVTDAQKGRVFGLLSLALPLAQGSIFLIVTANLPSIDMQLALVALAATLCLLPLLCQTPPPLAAPVNKALSGNVPLRDMPGIKQNRRDFALAWCARLLIQCASMAMGSYIFIHLTEVVADDQFAGSAELWMGRFAALAAAAGVLTGLALGIASDRARRRRPFLWPTSLSVGLGCAVLALASEPAVMAGGYALFAFGLAGFLTVDGAMVAQLVGTAPDRAAALGVMNLTNTLSGVLVPAAAIAMNQSMPLPTTTLFGCAAVGAFVAAGLVAMIRSVD